MKKLFLPVVAMLAVLLPPLTSAHAENAVPETGLYAFETSAGMKVGAAFGVLPALDADDELLSVTSPISPNIEIHEMKEVDGIMKMRKVDFMPVAKDTDNKLGPMGYHLMLMGLSAPLQKGTDFPVTLNFKHAGAKTLTVPVLARKAK